MGGRLCDRAAWIPKAAELRRDGLCYREIGEVVGVTAERVRQVLGRADRERRAKLAAWDAMRPVRLAFWRDKERTEKLRRVEKWGWHPYRSNRLVIGIPWGRKVVGWHGPWYGRSPIYGPELAPRPGLGLRGMAADGTEAGAAYEAVMRGDVDHDPWLEEIARVGAAMR